MRYDKDTGDLIWIKSKNRRGGLKVGSKSHGYLKTSIKRKHYLNHTLVYLYHHGYIPENDIDHIDRNPLNNKIENLREVSKTCNMRNSKLNKNNKSGVRGVNYAKKNKSWQVLITIHGKTNYIGHYKDFIEAVAHRLAAEQALDWNGCDSSSPAYLFITNLNNKGKK